MRKLRSRNLASGALLGSLLLMSSCVNEHTGEVNWGQQVGIILLAAAGILVVYGLVRLVSD